MFAVQRYIPGKTEDFDLLLDGDVHVFLLVHVVVTEQSRTKPADTRKARSAQGALVGPVREVGGRHSSPADITTTVRWVGLSCSKPVFMTRRFTRPAPAPYLAISPGGLRLVCSAEAKPTTRTSSRLEAVGPGPGEQSGPTGPRFTLTFPLRPWEGEAQVGRYPGMQGGKP